jgi:hypothetical protein
MYPEVSAVDITYLLALLYPNLCQVVFWQEQPCLSFHRESTNKENGVTTHPPVSYNISTYKIPVQFLHMLNYLYLMTRVNKEFVAEVMKPHFPTAQISSVTNFVLLMEYLGNVRS